MWKLSLGRSFRMGRDWLVDWWCKVKSIHFTPLWHTCVRGRKVGSVHEPAHTHTHTLPSSVSHSFPGLCRPSSLLLQLRDAGCTHKGLIVCMACIYAESPESQLCPIRVPQRESFVSAAAHRPRHSTGKKQKEKNEWRKKERKKERQREIKEKRKGEKKRNLIEERRWTPV